VKHTNYCDITPLIDERTNRLIAISAIDNLMKGASSQAVQNMNIMFGLEETTGIDMFPAYL
jgi:N-acetyl-gamma-glutamyl-phosphate reductase